jgi:transcriptional regulator with GAF, ATPase, and Fis domain
VQDGFARMLETVPGADRRLGSEEEVVARITERLTRLSSTGDADDVLELVGQTLHAGFVHCLMLDEGGEALVPFGRTALSLPRDAYPLAERPLLAAALRTMTAAQVRVDDPHGDPAERRFLREETGTGAMLVVPLVTGGAAIGVLHVHAMNPRWWTRTEAARARSYSYALGAVLAGLRARQAAAPAAAQRSAV